MDTIKKDLGWLGSSIDPTKIAATFDGLIVTFSGVIIGIAAHYGLVWMPSDLQTVAQNVAAVAAAVTVVIGQLRTVYGLSRKLIVGIKGMFSKPVLG